MPRILITTSPPLQDICGWCDSIISPINIVSLGIVYPLLFIAYTVLNLTIVPFVCQSDIFPVFITLKDVPFVIFTFPDNIFCLGGIYEFPVFMFSLRFSFFRFCGSSGSESNVSVFVSLTSFDEL